MKGFQKNKGVIFACLIIFLLLCSFLLFTKIMPLSLLPSRGCISVAFDDGFENTYLYAYPILHSKGIPASFYVITGWVNTENTYGKYMTVSELLDLQNNGNEIGSHTVDHANMDSLDAATLDYEFSTSKATLQGWGLNVVGFAYPNGNTRNAWTDQVGLQYYQYVRSAFQEPSVMTLPWNQEPVTAIQGDLGNSNDLAVMEAAVDRAVASNGWTIVVFHNVDNFQGNWVNHIGTDDFTAFLDYVQNSGAITLTVEQALKLRAEPTPTPISTPSPTIQPTATPTPNPTPSPTPTPVITPISTASPTIEPTPTPLPDTALSVSFMLGASGVAFIVVLSVFLASKRKR
jgi:peptidoglycan/xylan/chitin deacetylase (PgdA/CDA1 family)